ncbi:DNA polymerase III subunit gamma/tau [Piscinibacter sakaiensis]|uniref:DNA polymerase III subunit gamma/tau n=1 Tax=Piscinibacter sakaiensis TaxID=1547922 RepID=A0A0K8NWF3_PISS1|nr:DNA polymerase III subunit gamma/tau [Piscinibacter sakaiensis]GAP34629.1 DNA polymerase III, subunits gamma and tau [Piscinibacter sakaiensis]
MSYLVLARKYRPRHFEAMVGQEAVVRALANALTQQRLHHAYLFTGTRGVGKTTVSRILAKSLNCTGPDGQGGITASPCNACAACRDIDAGRFVDYVELDAASNRGVEEISQLLDQAVYKPVVGRFKVYMIDEVHMLSNHAFNAMLKTLEEPPDYLKFVLATTDPQKVPPTVLSRCLQFNLRPMAVDTVQAHLQQVLEAEGLAAEPGALRLLARAARGSMRDALSLCDQAIAHGAGQLDEEGVRRMLGAVDRRHAVRLLEALADADGAGLLAGVDGLRELGLPAAGTLDELAELLQAMAVAQAVPQAAAADDPAASDARRLAGRFGADETTLLYSLCLHGRGELGLAPDEYGGLTMVLLRMLAFRPGREAGGTAGRGARPGGAAAGLPEPAAGAPPAERPAAGRPAVPLQSPQAARTAVSLPPAAQATAAARPPAASGRATDAPVAPERRPGPPPALQLRAPASAPVALPTPAPPPAAGRPAAADDGLPPWLDAPPAEADDAGAGMGPDAGAPAFEPGPATPPRPAAAADPIDRPASAAARLQPTPLGARWHALALGLAERGAITALVRELAWQAQCVAIDEAADPPRWRLRVEREMLRAAPHVERLQAALAAALERPVRLETEPGPTVDTPALRLQAEREQRQQAAVDTITQDPDVRRLLAQFKSARIVPGSIQPC